ncbi:MAG: tetratricopeptide repeat protein [Chloroflexaceae bacterium]
MTKSRASLPARLWARWWHLWGLSLCYMGHTTHDRSFYRAGVGSFHRAIRCWPEFAPAHYQRGLIRGRELGEYAEAIADLQQASALRPEWPEPYLQRGLFHRFNGMPAQALADLRRFVELAPEGYWRDEAGRQIAAIEAESAGGVV